MLLNDLDYFVTLAEEGTFTKASQKKYVSQPSITNALQRLEKELGETLIIRQRGTRSVVLTEAGQILYKHSKQILRETEIIKSDISNQQKIWLGVPPIIGATIFPAIMRRLVTRLMPFTWWKVVPATCTNYWIRTALIWGLLVA